jgi:hypothetical protein
MARDKISPKLPLREATESVELVTFTKQVVTVANGIEIEKAFDNKNNSLFIIVEPTTVGTITFKAGDAYPNSMLGDLTVTPTDDQPNVYQILDEARFERRDGSLYIDFGTGFVGTIYAVAKRAGILPKANQ